MNGNEKSVQKKGVYQFDDVKWILHDGIGYLFPSPQKVYLSNQSETGSWYKINHQSDSPKEEITKEVFKLWIDHGSQPQDQTYQYIVVPSTTEQEMSSFIGNRKVEILSNTEAFQAVKHIGLNISQVIFYKSGALHLSADFKIGVDSPGLVMVKMEGSNVKEITVADPSRKLGKIHLSVTGRIEKSGEKFKSVWDKTKGISEISIDLPQAEYAGKSVTIEL